jgi:predicted phage terminase large subunit-like protein
MAIWAAVYSFIANASYFLLVLKGKMKAAGSSITHVGFALMLIGILISSSKKELISENRTGIAVSGLKDAKGRDENPLENITLIHNIPTPMGKYTVTYLGDSTETKNNKVYFKINFRKIDTIQGKEEEVFDVEIEGTENFIANGVVSHNTRWGKRDPIGRALAWAQNNPDSTPWNEVRFPAILPSGKSLWPEQWPVEQLLAKKAGMQPHFWVAQYMQEPTSEEGALIKREWWQMWTKDEPPDVEFVMQVWDTAHDTKSYNDYSACITWGVWFNENTNRHELIMLNAIKGRWEFPQLKEKALEQYSAWSPDGLLIEKKAAGAPLIQELRQMDMIVEEYSPSRSSAGVSNDKRARVNAVSPLFFDKVVWAPEQRWAMDVINECAEFPNGENDDFVDCCSMALARYRRGGFVSLSSDRGDEPQFFKRKTSGYY